MASDIPGDEAPARAAPNPSRLLDDVRQILRQARGSAYAAANTAMVEAYWQIGRRIVEEERGGATRATYGIQLLSTLSRDLGDEFGKGLSVANLKNFRQFYLTFPDAGKLYALRRELSWTHWRLVMRVEDPEARAYYIGQEGTRMGDDTRRAALEPAASRAQQPVSQMPPRPIVELRGRFAELARLENAINVKLKGLGYGS
jgi:hypothetical protein